MSLDCLNKYKRIIINGKSVLEHRYIWEQYNGPIPKRMLIHHINGIKCDNRIENLQLVNLDEHFKIHYNYKKINGEWWKPCTICGELKPITDYYKTSNREGAGVRAACKKCSYEYDKSRWENNEIRIKIQQTNKEYYEKNKITHNNATKEYYEKNKVDIREYFNTPEQKLIRQKYNKEYNEKNKLKLKQYKKEYYQRKKLEKQTSI